MDQIMAEALKPTGNGYSPPSIRRQAGEDPSPTPQAETRPAPAGIRLTSEQMRARRARSIAIALALGAFVLVIFAVTIVRLGSGVLTGPDYMRPVQPGQ
ncbi:MAG: hypothetical protein WBF58_22000 [Xanthobacteraceae bacterium]